MADEKPRSGTHPAVRDMSHEDWIQLFSYVHAANRVREVIAEAVGSGKQQVSIMAPAIKEFLDVGSRADPAFWFKLGTLCGTSIKPAE